MDIIVQSAAVLILIAGLLSMLYIGPSYFRRLRLLIERLETKHIDVYETLRRPSVSMLDSNIRSTSSLVRFILSRHYNQLTDNETIALARAARIRLIASFVISGAIFFSILLTSVLAPL